MKFIKSLLKPLAALLILALLVAGAGLAYYRPPLTDAPGIGTRLLRYLTGAPVETARYSAYPELRLHDYPRAPETVFNAAVGAVQALGWRIVSADAEHTTLVAAASYPIPEIEGRVSVAIRKTDSGLSALYVRAETLGPWPDLGANTRRVMALHRKMEAFL